MKSTATVISDDQFLNDLRLGVVRGIPECAECEATTVEACNSGVADWAYYAGTFREAHARHLARLLPPDFYAMHPSAQAHEWGRVTAALTTEPHTGQHLQGCVSCYEAVTPSSPVCPIHGEGCEAWA